VKRILILVRHIFNEAIRDKSNTLKENPTHSLQLTTVRKVKGKFLTPTQLTALLRAAEESDNKCLPDIIRVMGTTGLRRENVLAMEWAWIDEARGTLTVPAEADKAKKGFVLHLSAPVLNLLRNRRLVVDGPWVFPNPKTGKPYHSCRDARANLSGLRMHDLRHTYASMMLDSGADIVDVQHALGHTQLKTTAVYLHLREARKREHANAATTATGLFA
jgi:integrase